MNFKNLFIGAIAALALAACQKGSSGSPVAAPAPADSTLANPTNVDYAKGKPLHLFNFAGKSLTIDGVATDDESSLKSWPLISSRGTILSMVDRAIETDVHVLELYQGDRLILAIDLNNDNPKILHASSDFKADRIAYMRNADEQNQGMVKSSIMFGFNECAAPVEQKKEQPVAQEQRQSHEKGQIQGQSKGEVVPVAKEEPTAKEQQQGQVKAQEQVKGEPSAKEEVKAEALCKAVTVTLHFEGTVQKEQEQSKEQVKSEEQTKAPAAQEQVQAKKPVKQNKG